MDVEDAAAADGERALPAEWDPLFFPPDELKRWSIPLRWKAVRATFPDRVFLEDAAEFRRDPPSQPQPTQVVSFERKDYKFFGLPPKDATADQPAHDVLKDGEKSRLRKFAAALQEHRRSAAAAKAAKAAHAGANHANANNANANSNANAAASAAAAMNEDAAAGSAAADPAPAANVPPLPQKEKLSEEQLSRLLFSRQYEWKGNAEPVAQTRSLHQLLRSR